MAEMKCNILIVGITGAGKSSFCNYLFEEEFFKTGSGKPVTGWEENFQSHTFEKDSMPIEVFDTVGIEQNNYAIWEKRLNAFLNEYSTENYNPAKWIHGVFYVINAASGCVEPIDVQLIKLFLSRNNLPIQIILTNSDQADDKIEPVIEELKSVSPNLHIHKVCSVTEYYRDGRKTEPFGKEEVLKVFLNQSYLYIGKRIAIKTIEGLIEYLRDTKNTIKRKIDNSDLSIFNLDKMDEIDFDEWLPDSDDFDAFLDDIFKYADVLDSFDIKYQSKNELDEILERLEDVVDNINPSIADKMEQALDDVESGGLFKKIRGAVTIIAIALRIKKNLKEMVEEAFGQIIWELRMQKRNLEGNNDFYIKIKNVYISKS